MQAKIYHNPRCSKSRGALDILKEKQLDIVEIRYLDTPPTKAQLAELCKVLVIKPLDIVRTGESLFKELGLSKNDSKSDDEWLEVLASHPRLIERPIVQIGNKAVVARPPEKVLSIL